MSLKRVRILEVYLVKRREVAVDELINTSDDKENVIVNNCEVDCL